MLRISSAMKDAKVCIGTVFTNMEDPQQVEWLKLQKKFLDATTDNFDYVSFVHHGDPSILYEYSDYVLLSNYNAIKGHLTGIYDIFDFFKRNRRVYDYFLLLDNDAWPIKEKWLPALLNRMGTRNVAMPIRYENLETRFHASILFFKSNVIDLITFKRGDPTQRLDGVTDGDIGVVYPGGNTAVFPMIRTNRFNLHPVTSAIYYDTFYHHSCGTRQGGFKSNYYYNGIIPHQDHYKDSCLAELRKNPASFICRLAGWNLHKYVNLI